jgi:hypothetical protein
MAESAASAAFHSFFTSAGRTASAPHSSLQCALRAIATHRPTAAATATPALSLRALGKQRAEEPPSLEEECRRWLSEVAMNQQIFALAHSFWCSGESLLSATAQLLRAINQTGIDYSSGGRFQRHVLAFSGEQLPACYRLCGPHKTRHHFMLCSDVLPALLSPQPPCLSNFRIFLHTYTPITSCLTLSIRAKHGLLIY